MNILLVEDTAMNRKTFLKLLERQGHTGEAAEDGQQCLTMVCEKKYDLIFMDYMMPGMDGIETYAKMKELPGNLNSATPVIMLSAATDEASVDDFKAAGFCDFLSKPVLPANLEEAIAKWA